MYYIKCNHCGHLNEVKSEYQVFCSACNKKMDNNFADWRNRNPGKTFDDYKKLVCITEEEIPKSSPEKEVKPSKSLMVILATAAFIMIAYVVGYFAGDAIVKLFRYEKTSKEVLSNSWIKKTYGFGLTVETPVVMTEKELPMPDNVKQLIEEMHTYSYESAKGFKVLINSIKYKQIAQQVNLEGAAIGSVNEMKMQKGVSDFKYDQTDFPKGDIPGFFQKGTYKQDGLEIEFMNVGFAKGLTLWQVFTAYLADDEVGQIAAQKVIDSIEINEEDTENGK